MGAQGAGRFQEARCLAGRCRGQRLAGAAPPAGAGGGGSALKALGAARPCMRQGLVYALSWYLGVKEVERAEGVRRVN